MKSQTKQGESSLEVAEIPETLVLGVRLWRMEVFDFVMARRRCNG
ncbi:hypothetical protein [Roseateles noduli]